MRAKRTNKYGNHKTVVNDIKFDSKKEAERYQVLMQKLEVGEISDLKCQHSFTLQEAFISPLTGERVQAIKYLADFTYRDSDKNMVIEDVKSAITRENAVYKLKKKMMIDKGYVITEV